MKDKTRNALRSLLESLEQHEKETTYSAVEVDKEELRTLMRWAQNSAYVWFEGDRVRWTGARIPLDWMTMDIRGTVVEPSGDDGTAYVEWDGAPEHNRRVKMFHNEIKKEK